MQRLQQPVFQLCRVPRMGSAVRAEEHAGATTAFELQVQAMDISRHATRETFTGFKLSIREQFGDNLDVVGNAHVWVLVRRSDQLATFPVPPWRSLQNATGSIGIGTIQIG